MRLAIFHLIKEICKDFELISFEWFPKENKHWVLWLPDRTIMHHFSEQLAFSLAIMMLCAITRAILSRLECVRA